MSCDNKRKYDEYQKTDIQIKKCLEENCNKEARYNYNTELNVLYCNTHKAPNMINIKNLCIVEGCNIQASCNYPGSKNSLYCGTHKLEGMINVTKHT